MEYSTFPSSLKIGKMAFHDVHNIAAVRHLKPGNFALPRPPAVQGDVLLPDTTRLRATIKSIKSTLSKVGLGNIAQRIHETHDGSLPQMMQTLQDEILAEMRAYLSNRREDSLIRIFHLVQLWGGRAGRNIYVMNGGFNQNFQPDEYARFAVAAAEGDGFHRIERLIEATEGIQCFGVSFATKHARFWSEAGMNSVRLPIYDRVIALGCLGKKGARWNDYSSYAQELMQHALQAGISVEAMERYAFSAFDTPEGGIWLDARAARTGQSPIVAFHFTAEVRE